MKRDVDLIRDILFCLEDKANPMKLDYTENEINYHLRVIDDDGLFKNAPGGTGIELTWDGHELLELIRDHNRWKVIKRVLDELNCYSFEIICQIAIQQLKL